MAGKDIFKRYAEIFIEENHKVNLISKNDEKFLWEKHIFDSLSLSMVFEKYGIPETMLDFGTGGGFPSVPAAIAYPQIEITAVDSIGKKIRAVQVFKEKLNLKNLIPVCARVENITGEFDMVVSRAVSSLDKIIEYGIPKLKQGGYFVTFKSKKAQLEIKQAEPVLKKYKTKIIDIINYELPLEEKVERNLIVAAREN